MTNDPLELELLAGARAWPETQRLFLGAVDPTRPRHSVPCGWYGTQVDENEGAFCVVREGSPLEELVGDFVRVYWRGKVAFVYCVGGSGLSTELALARTAFMALAPLNADPLRVTAQAVLA